MSCRALQGITILVLLITLCASTRTLAEEPFVLVLGVAQDGGRPQAGTRNPELLIPEARRWAASLALIDPGNGDSPRRRWIFDATPDFREQLVLLDNRAPVKASPGLDGIFLTHAHIGHYTGLMFLGHESMGAKGVPVWAMPRMGKYLRENGPWGQLVDYENIVLRSLEQDLPVDLGRGLSVTPFRVPHREEYSEVVGFRIEGPGKSVVFLPDIDSWQAWEEMGGGLEKMLEGVDVAYVDATFWANGEIPGRDMSGFPHPRIEKTMERLKMASPATRAKVRFIHLNHTNPANVPSSRERREIERLGFGVASRGEKILLGMR